MFNKTNTPKIRSGLPTLISELTFGTVTENDKVENYNKLFGFLSELSLKNNRDAVNELVLIIQKHQKQKQQILQITIPNPIINDATAIKKIKRDRGRDGKNAIVGVTYIGLDDAPITVSLDRDQLKHQDPKTPIGNRKTSGGNKFHPSCDADWHKNTTIPYMAFWAHKQEIKLGQKKFHGQAVAVEGVHYEGFCQKLTSGTQVLFHCYPAKNGDKPIFSGISKTSTVTTRPIDDKTEEEEEEENNNNSRVSPG